jgi:DNA-binding transcriptional regulator GbsR (MarR family)
VKSQRTASSDSAAISEWEALVVEAVGTVIEFWRFKRNQGRVWALLYLRGREMTALELQEALALSKGAVSMVTRELEQWGVVTRVRSPQDASAHFRAETDLMRMVGRVIEERESQLVHGVKADLERAERLARASGDVPPDVLNRLHRMKTVATVVDRAVRGFLHTARLDVGGAVSVLSGALPVRRPRRAPESARARISPG